MWFVHDLLQKYLRNALGFLAGFNGIFRPK
jgi:hypothetical protein